MLQTVAIADPPLIPTGYERRLPPEVQLVVRARRRVLFRQAAGTILDLGGSDSHEALWPRRVVDDVTVVDGLDDPLVGRLLDRRHTFDTVVSICQLAQADDLERAVHRVRRLLGDDGRLRFLEPTRSIGVTGRLQSMMARPMQVLSGWHLDRDITTGLRSGGLSVTDLERHRPPTLQWWFRSFVEGAAHPALPVSHQEAGPG